MGFLNSIWLWGALGLVGIAVPIVIHLLNRLHRRTTDWAAMELLRRATIIRSKQLKLEDLIILLLRCLALFLAALAMARPTLTGSAARWVGGEPRAGVVIALDASSSMQHGRFSSRFADALKRTQEILATLNPGDPVSIVAMGAHPRILTRVTAYDETTAAKLLKDDARAFPETLRLETSLETIETLVNETKAPARECYLVTDAQASTWANISEKARGTLSRIAAKATVFLVPVSTEGEENMAITRLEFASGTLRASGTARFVAEVRNMGRNPSDGGTVSFAVNDAVVARKPLGRMEPGAVRMVSFLTAFDQAGETRISAHLGQDWLNPDNARNAVVKVPARIRVLCVDGAPGDLGPRSASYFLRQALRARQHKGDSSLAVSVISWQDLAAEKNLQDFDVVALVNVSGFSDEEAVKIVRYVRNGGGLLVFLGDRVPLDVYDRTLVENNVSVMPARLKSVESGGKDAHWYPVAGASAHPISDLVRSMPADFIESARIEKAVRIEPDAGALTLLALAGKDMPLLVEKSFGAGRVLLFASSADRTWGILPAHPLYPALIQLSVARLAGTSRQSDFICGGRLDIPVPNAAVGAEFRLRSPSGKESVEKVVESGGRKVVSADASEPGFYTLVTPGDARQSFAAANVDTRESDTAILRPEQLTGLMVDLPVKLVSRERDIGIAVKENRVGRELWRPILAIALLVFVLQGILARWFTKRARQEENADVADIVRQAEILAARKG